MLQILFWPHATPLSPSNSNTCRSLWSKVRRRDKIWQLLHQGRSQNYKHWHPEIDWLCLSWLRRVRTNSAQRCTSVVPALFSTSLWFYHTHTHTQTQIQFITLTLGISPPVSGRMTAVKCVTRSEQSSQSNQITRKLGERARRHRCLGNVLSDQWSVYGEPQGDERVSLWMSLHGMLHGWVIPQNVCVPRIHLKKFTENSRCWTSMQWNIVIVLNIRIFILILKYMFLILK